MKRPMLNRWAIAADASVAAMVAFAGVSAVTKTTSWQTPGEALLAALLVIGLPSVLTKYKVVSTQILLIALTVLLTALWTVRFGAWPTVLALSGWTIFILRRMAVAAGTPDNDVQTRHLISDLGFLACAWGLNALLGSPQAVKIAIVVAALLIILSRMAAMHHAQIAQDGGPVSNRALRALVGLFRLISATLVILAIFPSVRLMALLVALALLASYMVFTLWRDMVIQIAVDLGIVGLVVLALQLFRKTASKKKTPIQGTPGPLRLHLANSPHHLTLPPIDWSLVLLILGLLLIVLVVLRTQRVHDHVRLDQNGIRMERVNLSPRRRRPTRSLTPLRLLVARWLRSEARRGRAIQPGETLRSYATRRIQEIETETSSPEDHAILDLVAGYEEERYGLRPASEDTVNQLKNTLRQQHLGKG